MKNQISTYNYPHPLNTNFMHHKYMLGHIEGIRRYYPTLIKIRAWHGAFIPVKRFPTLLQGKRHEANNPDR